MNIDIPQAVDIVKDALLRKLGYEVDLIFRYGSSLKGNTHKYSDLDISYVPVHETTHDSITVLVDNTMIDLYPIRWSTLEQMANFENISAAVLLESEIVYQRHDAAGERFRQLGERLRQLQQPDAYPAMLRKAQAIFENTGYQYYLLRHYAEQGHVLACLQHARNILHEVVHCLVVCNQSLIDSRKLDQVLGLEKLPQGFADTVHWITYGTEPDELLVSCEVLMESTRRLLLAEQAAVKEETTFPAVFGPAYPEFKGDIHHLMLACERRDMFNLNFMALYHEVMIHTAQALTGIGYSGFNSIAEYEQDLVALGFPDLLSYIVAGDLDGLHAQCQVFDRRLQQFLTEHGVPLYSFASLDDLRDHLK